MVRTKVFIESCAGLETMSWKVAKHERQKLEPCSATYMYAARRTSGDAEPSAWDHGSPGAARSS